jgi:hypothetical protein
MPQLAVLTPSFRPDFPLFAELHRSVLVHTPADTIHYVIVPAADKALFNEFAGDRCQIWTVPDLLPRRIRHLYDRFWLNLTRPWPVIRGWVLQQAIKVAGTAALDADVVLLVDSDVTLVRPVTAARFQTDGVLNLTRLPDGVTADLPRHVRWHTTARELLGLPPAGDPPLPDYISPLNFWDPRIVRAMQQRIEETTGRNWLDVFCTRLLISEFILYGVFVDEVWAPGSVTPADAGTCHNYWDRVALDDQAAAAFAEGLPAEAVAVMITSRSDTTLAVRRAAIGRCARIAEG